MSQSTIDQQLNDILSEPGQTGAQNSAPWSKQEDDELLKELYALMGDIPKEPEKPAERAPEAPKPAPKPAPVSEAPAQPAKPKPEKPAAVQPPVQKAAAPAQPAPALPEQEPLRTAAQEDWEELPSERSAPGWLKGTFLFLISLLLCGMTLYAVAADVLGPLF